MANIYDHLLFTLPNYLIVPSSKSQVTADPPLAPLSKGGWGDQEAAPIVQNGITSHCNSPDISQYLQSLKPTVRQLRKSYRTRNQVQINYDCSQVQASYLLAYYPHYVEMAEMILKQLANQGLLEQFHQNIEQELFQTSGELTLSIFAAGAAPEAVAICQYISNHFPVETYGKIQGKLTIYTFDLEDYWTDSRFLTEHGLLPNYFPRKQLNLISHTVDLLAEEALEKFKPEIQTSHLLMFQNCLNELAGKEEEHFIANFNSLLKFIPPSSAVVISDLGSYNASQDLIQNLKTKAVNFSDMGVFAQLNSQQYRTRLGLPSVITDHLLTGENDLIPRKNINYMFLFLEKFSQEVANYITKGNTYVKLRRWHRAIKEYSKALEIAPHTYLTYSRRASAYRKIGEYEKAIQDYTRALTLCQEKAEDYYHRSLAYRHLQDYDKAIADCQQALNLTPDLAAAYNHFGNLAFDLEEYETALEKYQQALKCNPNLAMVHNNLGVTYSKLNQYHKAKVSYDMAVQLNPNYQKARQNLEKIPKNPP
ncbi:MAG: tetratricopeptide repeat protein [Cyanobacteriota bacterium]